MMRLTTNQVKDGLQVLFVALMCLSMAMPAQAWNSNKSIKVDDGARTGSQSTVNGSVTIGRDAVVDGDVETVNGTIRIEENATVDDASTVNGGLRVASGVTADSIESVNGKIRLGENVTIDRDISVVNGKIRVERGSRVGSDVSNVNGEITLIGVEVGGDVTTVNGNVSLSDQTVVQGQLLVEKPSGWGWNNSRRKPKVIVGPGSRVVGGIELEREVELYISNTADVSAVRGVMSMDDAVRFDGAFEDRQ